ncbi:MAG: extracellular solute-binding protein [Clostridia bacterium]|nr:extracellular solute-binding protein [Clostridia bacterium]
MKKRLMSVLMAGVLLVTATAGCGEPAASSEPPENSDVATTATSAVSTTGTNAVDSVDTTTGTEPSPTTAGASTTKTTAKVTTAGTLPGGDAPLDTDSAIDRDKYYEQNKNVAMPQRTLSNKTVTVFSWRDQMSDGCYSATKPDLRKVYADAGLTIKWYAATFENYMDTLSAAKVSGETPDLLEWDVGTTYPAAIASKLVVPIDDYIDFTAPIWADALELTKKYQIANKTYFSVEYMQINELMYYDPTIIKQAGLETPLELWRKGKWTLKAMQNIADKTRIVDTGGKVTRIGLIPGDVGMITGLELVEYNRAKGYKLNIANSKYKTLMNTLYDMGVAGTQSAGFSYPSDVGKGTAVMSMTAGWAMTHEMDAARRSGRVEWCILPKLDDKSEHTYNLTLQLTFGILDGAKNPEGAAYVIELRKWAFLNYPWLEALPFSDTAYTRKYGEKKVGTDSEGVLTAAEQAYTQELLSKDYTVIAANLWGGWLGSSQFPGLTEVVSNGNQWSTVLANKKTTLEAILKHWKFS